MPAQAKTHISISPDTSYATRDNIAVPQKTLGRTAAVVAVNADTHIETSLRSTADSDVALSGLDTPVSANE